jgi:hypothetical protein
MLMLMLSHQHLAQSSQECDMLSADERILNRCDPLPILEDRLLGQINKTNHKTDGFCGAMKHDT